jgi:DNA-binding response OmpR family regulator
MPSSLAEVLAPSEPLRAVTDSVRFGSIEIDRQAYAVSIAGSPVTLTARELSLLVYLSKSPGRLLTREELVSQVWGPTYDGGNRTVDIHVSRLRRKLGQDLPLVTLRRVGYRLDAPPARANEGTDK